MKSSRAISIKSNNNDQLAQKVVRKIFQNLTNPSYEDEQDEMLDQNEEIYDFESNIYLMLKGLYFKQISPNLKHEDLTTQFLLKDQEIVMSMKDIGLLHQDLDFWTKESMSAVYSFDFKNSSKSVLEQKNKNVENTNSGKNLMIRAKQEYINKNLQQFLLQHSQQPEPSLTPYSSKPLAQKIKRSFCLYNRTATQNRIHTTTNYELYCGVSREQDKQRRQTQNSQEKPKKNVYSGEGYNIISNHLDNSPFQELYQQKLESCKEIAHAYVYSGYGYRRYVSHGFDMEMRYYRAYLASMMRVVFRQLEKFVFESQTYKKMFNITNFEAPQDIYQPPEDQLPDNPRERIPYKEFQCCIRPLYHVEKNFPKEMVAIWKKLFRVTFNLDETVIQDKQQGKQVPLIQVEKAQEQLNEQEIVDCYLSIRKHIKEIVNQRMISDMKRIGLDPSQGLNWHLRTGAFSKNQGEDQYEDEGQLNAGKMRQRHGYYTQNPMNQRDSQQSEEDAYGRPMKKRGFKRNPRR